MDPIKNRADLGNEPWQIMDQREISYAKFKENPEAYAEEAKKLQREISNGNDSAIQNQENLANQIINERNTTPATEQNSFRRLSRTSNYMRI